MRSTIPAPPVRRSPDNKTALAERLFWVSGWVYDFSKIATLLLVCGLIVHYFFFTILVVRGASMEPNYQDGQILVVDKFHYLTNKPSRGDVVAMYFPGETEKRFIKRVVGLPNEHLRIEDGFVYIDGQRLTEPYLTEAVFTIPDLDRQLVEGEYFVLGDNRSVSSDSRAWGTVPRRFIAGKVTAQLNDLNARLLNTVTD